MGLCGAGRNCGCVIKMVPATTSAIKGSYPTINVDGGGGADSPWSVSLNENWTTHVARAIEVTPWTPIQYFLDGWENYHLSWNGAEYRKVGDIVHLRGLIKNASFTVAVGAINIVLIAQLPEGFRPPRPTSSSDGTNLIFAVDRNSPIHARVDVYPNGDVKAVFLGVAVGDLGYWTLTGIEFSTSE